MSKIIIPENYTPALNLYDTQRAIGTVKRLFADTLCATLNLYRVSAPLFLEASTGLNDDLNGVERKVTFDMKDGGIEAQVVQSLAKWKRKALKDYGFRLGSSAWWKSPLTVSVDVGSISIWWPMSETERQLSWEPP